jgi:hypothetical protein
MVPQGQDVAGRFAVPAKEHGSHLAWNVNGLSTQVLH